MGCKAHKTRRKQFGSDIRHRLMLFLAGEMWRSQLQVSDQGDPGPTGLRGSQGGLYIHSPTSCTGRTGCTKTSSRVWMAVDFPSRIVWQMMPTKCQNRFLKTIVLFPFPKSIYKMSNSSPSSKLSKALPLWQLRQVSLLQTLQRVPESRSGAPEQLPKISLALKRESCWCSQSSFVLLRCQTFGSVFPNQFSRPCRKLNQAPASPWLSHCPVLTAGLAEFKPFFFLSDCFPYSLLLNLTKIFVQ